MKGMADKPMAVIISLIGAGPSLVVLNQQTIINNKFPYLLSRYKLSAHKRLIVTPGMTTEAKPCQARVSTNATTTCRRFSSRVLCTF